MNELADFLTAKGWAESTLFVRSFQLGALACRLWKASVFGTHTASGPMRGDEWTLGTEREPGVYTVVAKGSTVAELQEALRRRASAEEARTAA